MLLSLLSKRALEVESRDAYGFAVRPQYIQGYKDHTCIYKEEEDERSDKWENFLERQLNSAQPSSLEEICKQTSHTEATTPKEESVSDRSGKDDTSCSVSDSSGSTEKEVQPTKNSETLKVRPWIQIKPSLCAVDHMMSLRVKMRKNTIDHEKDGAGADHPSPIKEAEPSGVVHEENFEDHANEVSDDTKEHSIMGSDEDNGVSSVPVFPWKEELDCLVRGGVPKELRGEVWQAFVGVKTRRVERYYEDLLADTEVGDINGDDVSLGVPTKWTKQIEKDIPRTFPGHPALDDNGRNSLRRLLLAYSQHNPSVGYCQAMNYFAGLLLLLMPEENAFWALVGIIDDYFEGYYTEQMVESQVDQLVLEELMQERFPKLVSHLDYLGVQVTWVTASWFLSIFVNMLPWESVLRVWDVLLYEGNRVMLFRTTLALMELYGPALVTTKDAGDALSLLQSMAGSTFDSSQLVMTACVGFLCVTEARLQELRKKHRPSVLQLVEERLKGPRAVKESADEHADENASDHPESPPDFDDLTISSEDALPDLQEQVDWLKVEICRLMEDKKAAVLRAEELERARMEMTKEDNRPQLVLRIEQLEEEVEELRKTLLDRKEQEDSMIEVLLRVEQQQKATEDARRSAEKSAVTQKYALRMLEEKYEKALSKVAKMETKVIMAETMLEATLQYESGQIKAQAIASPGHSRSSSMEVKSPTKEKENQNQSQIQIQSQSPSNEGGPLRKMRLLSRPFALGWGDKNKGNATNPRTED